MKGVIIMITYLLIGVIVQLIIVVERIMRGVTGWFNLETGLMWVYAMALVLFMCAINIITWPLTIILEIINIKKGI